jgi:hypothetical protein
MVMQAHHWIDSDFIANMMLTIVKAKISIKIKTIQSTIYKDILYDILYKKSWLAKKKILERLFRSYEEFFQILPRLLLALKESNFGIIV